jgi:hypothetical protein
VPTIRIDGDLWERAKDASASIDKPLSTIIGTFLDNYIISDSPPSATMGLARRPNGAEPRKIATFYANKDTWATAKTKARSNGETLSNAITKFLVTFVTTTEKRRAAREDAEA